MFSLRILPVGFDYIPKSKETATYLNSTYHKTSSLMRDNIIFSRALIEFLGADLPSAGVELIGRNWQKAVEDLLRISLNIINSMFIPLALIPIWNKISSKQNKLPDEFNQIFEHQFEDLLPEKDNPKSNKEFVNKLVSIEGEDSVNKYLCGLDENQINQKISDLKKNIIKSKTDVMKMDILSAGLLAYQGPWIQNWFSKTVLGVIGFSGEMSYLSESEREENSSLMQKITPIKYILGLAPVIWGSGWYSKNIQNIASSNESDLSNSPFKLFLRKNIKQFDYYKKIFSNKLNLFGTFLFGGNAGFLLSSRSLNEVIERVIRLAVFYPTGFWGDGWFHYKLAANSDRKNETLLVDNNSPLELGLPKVKNSEELLKELQNAEEQNDNNLVNNLVKSIKANDNFLWAGIGATAAVMGVGLTSINIIGTKWRIEKGIY